MYHKMKFLRRNLNILLLVLVGITIGVHGQKCGHYFQDGGVCANYISKDDYVMYDKGKSILDMENSFRPLALAQALSTLRDDDKALESCVQDFTSFVCSNVFPKCGLTSDSKGILVLPCKSTCDKVLGSCNLENKSEEAQEIIKTYILSSTFFPRECNGTIGISPLLNFNYPTEKCNSSPQLSIRPKCLSPLIEDRRWVETNKIKDTDSRFCKKGCCLPCPQSYHLYPKNLLGNGFLITQILRAISAVGSGFLLVSYLVLPGKQTHPSKLIFFAALLIFLYSFNVFFSIGNPTLVQCKTDVIPSTQENNPFFCGFQGTLLIFASHATALWIGAIILNLHIHTVWNSNILSNKYTYIHLICWGIPAILAIIALATKSVSYQFATLCLVEVKNSSYIFFYPLGAIVIPSFILHMATFGHIFRIFFVKYKRRHEISKEISQISLDGKEAEYMSHRLHVLQAIRIQWRALLLAIILITTVIFYWLFYFVELKTIANGGNDDEFLVKWTTCIQSGNGQNVCAKEVTSKYMPRFSLIFAAEAATSIIGIYLVTIFSNWALFREWKQWIHEKFRSRNHQDQFFAI